ncbi:MAG TPA: hypothetical protein VNS79_05095 [Sphingobium sp.]|nr:hypothetical protein [Sphingobium sp.]
MHKVSLFRDGQYGDVCSVPSAPSYARYGDGPASTLRAYGASRPRAGDVRPVADDDDEALLLATLVDLAANGFATVPLGRTRK